MSEGAGSRAAAARAVAAVVESGRTLETALPAPVPRAWGDIDRAQVQALAYGTVRFALRLRRVATQLLSRRWEDHPVELQAVLLVGLYQLEYARTPPHAAVDTAVEAARLLGQGRAAGLVNACLRRYQRERDALLAKADASLPGRTSHPEWFVSALERDWGGTTARTVLDANNAHPPLWLRANARRTTTEALAATLAAEGHATTPCAFAPRALKLDKPVDVRALPSFVAGLCSVQDAAAQLAAPFLDVRPGMRVLDACAAPGGKTGHLLEEVPDASVVALDIEPERVERIRGNLERLGLRAEVVVGDALADDWWDGRPFNRILLDAPCSGTGVIRRHPDIKLLRRPDDLGPLVERQARLLDAQWRRLAPGGRLVYASCSVLKAENAQVVAAFLTRTPEAVEVTESARLSVPGSPNPPAAGASPTGPGYALLPGTADTDGFFYACLQKGRA
jgi:16S rRNA (cytosine967-C5)-methyltransferase